MLPCVLGVFALVMPMTVSWQRSHSDTERGMAELRSLIRSAAPRPAASDLLKFESKYPNTQAASLARFLRGYLYYEARNYQQAADALDVKTISAHSSLGDYALFYRAESLAALNSKSDALRDYGILYTKHPDSLKARESRLRAAQMAIETGDPQSAIKEMSSLAESNDSDALYITALAHESLAKNDQAIRVYRRIYFELPATVAGARAEERLAALGATVKDNPGSFDEMLSRAGFLFNAKQYAEAARAYDELIARFPEAERNDETQLRRGVSLLNSKQPAQAVLPLSRVSSRNAELHVEALFNQAEALRRSNRVAESGVIVDRLLAQYPKNRRAGEALYGLATFLDKQGRASEAAARYRQLVAAYPGSEYAAEASYNLGWQAYKDKRYTDAARILQQHLASYRYPQTKFIGEAGLWAAKSEELMGNHARALALYDLVNERYRYGYHGYISGLRANALRRRSPGLKSEAAKPGSDLERIRANVTYVENIRETADGSEAPRATRADDLQAIGLDELVIKELNEALASAPSSPRLNLKLAQVYSGRGENFQATLILRRGYPDIYSYRDSDLPREAWEIFFPLVEWETIKTEARRYGIDPFIAAGLIRQESVFNPNAISRVGARGLMQVMPATGQLISRRQGNGNVTAAELHNPSLNIKLGMNYLAQMLGQFGRIEYAAAGYNAGPGRAKRWIAERGSLDIEDWIESIPFTETRGYVQGVLRYAANYRRFYKE
ncbi:MAG TPA: transglycosylase SLT domain-containing protein [Blastocatellia bacterium]|nr:transglycosylase SLT domain-containing protein [Blastocatellia bacterium]